MDNKPTRREAASPAPLRSNPVLRPTAIAPAFLARPSLLLPFLPARHCSRLSCLPVIVPAFLSVIPNGNLLFAAAIAPSFLARLPSFLPFFLSFPKGICCSPQPSRPPNPRQPRALS